MLRSSRVLVASGAAASLLLLVHGCSGGTQDNGFGTNPPGSADGSAGGEGGPSSGDSGNYGDAFGGPTHDDAQPPPTSTCVNLQCQQHSCGDGGSTTISGAVYDPAGKNPLYDVVVYVPNSPVKALPSGASCDSCDALFSGDPIAATITDANGRFTLQHVPDGQNIPLVIQVGKWRKQITIPKVLPCQDNAQPDKSLKLPKNHNEGDIPNIAISTGGADTLECLLSRIGVEAGEYVGGGGGAGKIHIFQGGGGFFGGGPNTSPPGPASNAALWSSKSALMAFDIVLLSCEGAETTAMNQQALHDYASAGGRVFASHYHYAWFNSGPYASENLATWSAGTNDMGNINANIVTLLPNNQPFPKGQALKDWLGNVNALQGGKLPIQQARHNADVSAANTPSQQWITADQSANPPNATEYFSFNTPTNAPIGDAGVPAYCGRVVFSDLHVGAASGDNPLAPVPSSCANADLSPQEKALEFMLFDLSSCVTVDNLPPQPPPTPPPPPPK